VDGFTQEMEEEMKPILFSTPMVKAILDGRKTMTRRVIKFPKGAYPHWYHGQNEDGTHDFMFGEISNGCCLDWSDAIKSPYKDGDVLWVRETWGIGTRPDPGQGWVDGIEFKADEAFIDEIESLPLYHTDNEALFELYSNDESKGWHPSIHMPREAARLFLRVTGVRAERVQDISTSDCEREGIASDIDRFNGMMTPHHNWIVGEYAKLWNSQHAKSGHSWDSNLWVWVISFERIGKEEVDNG
jgi:hypothetical protein